METFDKWFTRFMWGTDIVLLAASTPHIATWYQHFDNASDPISTFYSWLVGYGLAIAIDGVSLMLLYAMIRIIKHGTKSKGTIIGILLFMAFIMGLSWFINWQYDWVYGSNSFARADNMTFTIVRTFTVGQLNPVIGGAFSVLMMAYAIIAKAVRSEAPVAEITDEEFERQKRDIRRKQELKDLRKVDNETGLIAGAKERLLGKEKDTEKVYQDRLNAATDYMRNATDLLDRSQEQKAIELLAVFLKINKKESAVYLEAVRPILLREKEQMLAPKPERTTGPILPEFSEELEEESDANSQENFTDPSEETGKPIAIPVDMIELINLYPKAVTLLDRSASTIAIADVASIFNRTPRLIKNRADAGRMSYVKGREKVYKDSVIKWAKEEMIGRGNRKVIDIGSALNPQEESEDNRDEKVSG